ncbi:MAG: phosphate ABC transporter permease PstA [Candidatus Eisenbacteria bacterium]|uniref:Phosphate transport system permease protein PstA n=1 Tax=Eiseniibacteriota bacterium TaxID=2212470 RepID=A0A538STP1_UNCEI|nr:MAG: phosphate ABC transporter permease PstA [Candidatus Eisenbacteria bacterium]
MSRPALTRAAGHINRRAIWSRIVIAACYGAGAIVVLPLALIVWHLLAKGLPALSLSFFLDMPKPVGEPGGGMANAIVGTLILVGLGTLFAVPVGVGAGVYLAEFGRGRFSSLVRYTADLLSGVPSIVVGVAAYGLVVLPMGGFSALAGGVALGILMLPTIIRSTEEMVRLVPQSYREAALALGAPRWKVTQQVVIPAARAGIVTASMLAVARAAGETAPLLFTALGNRFWSTALTKPIASLPVFVFDYARAPYDDWNRQAWTGALVLVMMVTGISAVLRLTVRRVAQR